MVAVGTITGEAVQLLRDLENNTLTARADYAATQLNTRLLLAGAALLSLLGTAGIFFMFYRRVTLPLQGAVLVAERVATGDLTHHRRLGRTGEAASLMLALNTMQGNLAAIVTEVRLTTTSIADASAQLATGNADLSSRTEEQASRLEETASSMEEFSSTIKQTHERMRTADTLAVAASKAATNGSRVATDAVAKIAEVNQSAKRIGDIIGMIDGIDQVARAVAQMEDVTQQNAALVEESAAAAESMRDQAEALSELVSRFTLDDARARESKTRTRRTAALADGGPPTQSPSTRLATELRKKPPALSKELQGEWEEF